MATVLREIERTVAAIRSNIESGYVVTDAQLLQLRAAKRNVVRLRDRIPINVYTGVIDTLHSFQGLLERRKAAETDNETRPSHRFCAPRSSPGSNGGRPEVHIEREQLDFGCSHSVVKKKLYSLGLKSRNRFTNISDADLEAAVKQLHESHPNAGSQMMAGYLKSRRIIVQRQRIRDTLNNIDPLSTATRWSKTISRRRYSVPTPNSLWHIDGNMKLIRWGFAIHGCIDGYSRLVCYLKCATNNKARTVLKLFVQATEKFGLPSRVRSDYGGENFHVALFMNLVHGGMGNHITGESVHNERIERFWRDCFVQAIQPMYNMFYGYEEEGLLDPNDIICTSALKIVYLPEINRRLHEFLMGWNQHSVRAEGHRTPQKIWIDGMLRNMHRNSRAVNEIFSNHPSTDVSLNEVLQAHGVDAELFENEDENEPPAVEIPHSNLDIAEEVVQNAID